MEDVLVFLGNVDCVFDFVEYSILNWKLVDVLRSLGLLDFNFEVMIKDEFGIIFVIWKDLFDFVCNFVVFLKLFVLFFRVFE